MAETKGVRIPWSFKSLCMLTSLVVLLVLAANGIMWLFDFEKYFEVSSQKTLVLSAVFILQEIILIVPLLVLTFRHVRNGRWNAFGFRWIGFWKTIGWTLRGYGLVIVINIILVSIMTLGGFELPGFGRQEPFLDFFAPDGWLDWVLTGLILTIIAPLAEEIFFRGFILQTLLARYRMWVASMITAALFAIVHFSWESTGIIFILGLILNWLFIRTRSIWPTIAFHVVNNALAMGFEALIYLGKITI